MRLCMPQVISLEAEAFTANCARIEAIFLSILKDSKLCSPILNEKVAKEKLKWEVS